MRKSEREYFKLKVKGTIKRAISQTYLRKSEREYFKPKVKDTIKRVKSQIKLHISVSFAWTRFGWRNSIARHGTIVIHGRGNSIAIHEETKFKGDYTQVPCDRVTWYIDKFIVLVGMWAQPIRDELTELLEKGVSLPYFEFVYDEHM